MTSDHLASPDEWRLYSPTTLVAALSAASFSIALTYFLALQVRRSADAKAAWLVAQERLAEKSALLEATLKNMSQGLLMLDPERRILISNAQAADLLGLPPGFLDNRPHYFDVLTRRWDRSRGLDRSDEEVVEMIRRGGPLDHVHVSERLLPNGRIVEARNVPFEGGRVVRTYTDITERKNSEHRILYIARHDELTGLANRSAFNQFLLEAVSEASLGSNGFALLCLDLDRFKLVNDSRGHEFGDKLLAEAGRRMRSVVREVDLVARIGGDEFAIVQISDGNPDASSVLARRLLTTVAQPYDINGQQAAVGASIGIAIYGQDGNAPDLLLRRADTALYRAKENGRNTYCRFEAAMDVRHQERALIERDLRHAIELGQLELAYQPIYEIVADELKGFEALLRWNHPTRGLIKPDHFIPVAEMSGLIVPIGLWVIEVACAEAAGWNGLTGASDAPPLHVAVNLSPVQFRELDLPDKIAEILERTGLSGTQLELEVTEGLLLDDSQQVSRTIERLKQQGIRITLDDFGSAYASLSYLRRFPFDRIKIDRTFITKIAEDRQSRAIVEAILTLSRNLNLDVVAEGVQSQAELDILQVLGCNHVQGFLTGKPLSAAHARAVLSDPCRRMSTAVQRTAQPQAQRTYS